MNPAESTITVTRNHDSDLKVREVLLWIDEQPFAKLLYQQSVAQALAPGKHVLKASNTMQTKQIEFELSAGEQARFNVANRSGCGSSMIFMFGAGPIYLRLEREA